MTTDRQEEKRPEELKAPAATTKSESNGCAGGLVRLAPITARPQQRD